MLPEASSIRSGLSNNGIQTFSFNLIDNALSDPRFCESWVKKPLIFNEPLFARDCGVAVMVYC
jgi:hypothetical protein